MSWTERLYKKQPSWFNNDRCSALWDELEPELNQYGYSLREMTRVTRPVAFEGLATIIGFDTDLARDDGGSTVAESRGSRDGNSGRSTTDQGADDFEQGVLEAIRLAPKDES